MDDIIWMNAEDVVRIHNDVILTSGGLPGTNSHNSVEATISRVKNHAHYIGSGDFYDLVALVGFSIVKGHAFNDGNKRTALITMDVFAQINGYNITAEPLAFANQLIGIADNKITHVELTHWLRTRMAAL